MPGTKKWQFRTRNGLENLIFWFLVVLVLHFGRNSELKDARQGKGWAEEMSKMEGFWCPLWPFQTLGQPNGKSKSQASPQISKRKKKKQIILMNKRTVTSVSWPGLSIMVRYFPNFLKMPQTPSHGWLKIESSTSLVATLQWLIQPWYHVSISACVSPLCEWGRNPMLTLWTLSSKTMLSTRPQVKRDYSLSLSIS